MLRLVGFAASLLALSPLVNGDMMYTKNSPVLQVTTKTYDTLIRQSNGTSIVEFYAPWCGHCQNLKPAYEKAAKNLEGLAKVAAVNCNEDENKQLCGTMEIKGFPTLKIVKPGNKYGRPIVEEYQGPRTAKGIVDAVIGKIPNHVKRIEDDGLEKFLTSDGDRAKALLFSDKGTISALLKSLAVDFLDVIDIGQVRKGAEQAAERFGITKFPTLVLIPAEGMETMTYNGEMKKADMVAFLSRAAPPNPQPIPGQKNPASPKKSKSSSSSKSAKSAFKESSASQQSAQASESAATPIEVLEDPTTPIGSPGPAVTPTEIPIQVPLEAKFIPTLSTQEELVSACLQPKSGNCILVLHPSQADVEAVADEATSQALSSLAEIADSYKKRGSKIFPFYAVPESNEASKTVRAALGLSDELEVIALNMKRGWYKKYSGTSYSAGDVSGFVDNIKLGEFSKEKLPEGFFATKVEEPAAQSGHEEL